MPRLKGSKNKVRKLPSTIPESPVPENQKQSVDAKLLNIQALDELIADRNDALSKVQDKVQNREAYLQSIEADIDLKKRESNQDLLVRREVFEEELGVIRNDLMAREKQTELVEQGLSDREVGIVTKEEEIARYEEERRKFEDRSLLIRQAEMEIENRINEAEGLKNEYEARIKTILKIQDEAEKKVKECEAIEENNRVYCTDLENREKRVKVQEQSLKDSEAAFRRQLNGSATPAEVKV